MRIIVLSLIALTVPAIAGAQLMEPPARQTVSRGNARVVDPNRPAHALIFQVNMLGGYNLNHVPPTALQAPELEFRPSSYTGSTDAALRYSLTKGGQNLDVTGGGRANMYTNVGGDQGPVYGSNVSASYGAGLGRSTTFSLSQSANRSPYLALGLFDGLQTAGSVAYDPEGNSLNGILEGQLWSLSSSVGLGHSWTGSTTTAVRYGYQTREHLGGADELSQKDHSGALDLTQRLGQNIGLRATYRVANRRTSQIGLRRQDLAHGITGGFQMGQEITRTRAVSLAAGGGAELVDSGGAGGSYWQPSFYGSVGVDIARSWTASANYNQTSSVVFSPISTPDSYLTQAAVVSAGGNLGGRLDLVVNAGYSSGRISAVRSITGARGDFTGFTTSAQVRTLLAGGWSTVVSVNHYQSQLTGAASQFLQSSGEFRRSSVRVGFSWSRPLYDSNGTRRPRRR